MKTAAAQPQQASLHEVATQWQKVTRRALRQPVQITYKGKPSAFLLVRRADYNRMQRIAAEIERLEDEADIAMYEARKDEPGRPFDEFVAELKRDGEI